MYYQFHGQYHPLERRFFKLNVSLSSDTDDIENDMNELFQLLSNGK